jgi:hypothetical protein
VTRTRAQTEISLAVTADLQARRQQRRRGFEPLPTIIENDDAGADEFGAVAKNPSDLDRLGDCGEPKPVVQRLAIQRCRLGT